MEQELKYIAVIPAYEPDENLPRIVNELKENNFIVIVVNDGSDINYDKYYNECNTKIISYPINRGKGYALKKGFEYIKNNYENYVIVTVDSDGQHQVEDAINLCEYVKNNKDTLVIGKRLKKNNTPLRSLIGNAITRYVFNLATGEKIYDTQSGLRAFSEQLIDYMLQVEGNRFEYEMNILLYIKQNNIKYKEIEIKTIYFDNNKKSHFKTIKDSLKIYVQIIKFKMIPVISFLIDLIIYGALIISIYKIVLTNIISKIIGIGIYYLLNRKKIIEHKLTPKNIGIQLLIIISYIALNTIMIYMLSKIINPYTSKVIIEILLFICIQEIRNRLDK